MKNLDAAQQSANDLREFIESGLRQRALRYNLTDMKKSEIHIKLNISHGV